MESKLITVDVSGASIILTPDSQAMQMEVAGPLKAILSVASADGARAATDCVKRAKTFLKDVEACRKEVKAPVLALGSEIDALSETLSGSVQADIKRVEGCLADYSREQARIARAQEDKRQEDLRKAQAEIDAAKKAAEVAQFPYQIKEAQERKEAVMAQAVENPCDACCLSEGRGCCHADSSQDRSS